MVVLRVILGILVILTAMDVIMFPAMGTIALYWIITAFMLVFGIFAIIHFIEDKNKEKVERRNGRQYVGAGVGSLIAGIAGVVLSILAMTKPNSAHILMIIISVLFGLFITFMGISNIILANMQRKVAAGGWLPLMILGILIAILGVACIFNSFFSFVAMGTMVGVNLMIFGITLIVGRD